MIPNTPIKRLQYVIKQYDGTKNQYILPDVIVISLYAFGRDRDAQNLDGYGEHPALDAWRGQPWPQAPSRETQVQFLEQYLDDALPPTHEWDFIVPWIARELGRLYKAVRKYEVDGDDYEAAAETLEAKAPAIAMWALQNRVDLNKTSLAEALEAVKEL